MRSVSAEKPYGGASPWPLLARNIWRTLNVIVNRRLGKAPGYLPVILLFVTNRCNLRCLMCGVCEHEHIAPDTVELDTEEWKAVIHSAAARLGTTIASISGGEPLVRKDIYDIIRCAADAGMSVHLCTNAVLLNADRAEKLRDSGLSTISISVDGACAEEHDYLRGDHSFEAAVEGIRLVRRWAPHIRVGINYLITRRNFRRAGDMLQFAESLGVHQIKFAPIHANLLHRDKAHEEYGDLWFRPEDLEALGVEMDRLKRACAASALSTNLPDFFDGITDFYRGPRRFQCYAGYAVCAIGATGLVAPCCDMESTFSVREQPLDAIWRDPAFHALRKQVHHCEAACWDTTNTELSLRLRPWPMIRDTIRTWRDLRFYLGGRHD